MRRAHAVADVREAERALLATLPAGSLMDRAAAGLAATCARLLGDLAGGVYGSRVLVLAGSGDNGGDALLAGARLAGRGAALDVLVLGDRVHEAALAAARRAGAALVHDVGSAYDLVLDGIVGIGGAGPLRPRVAAVLDRVPPEAFVVAVDVPSGVDADTGEVAGAAVSADVTVTFGTYKPGLLVDPGAERAGVVELVDIGLAPSLPDPVLEALQTPDVAGLLPRAGRESDKYARGVVGVAAGSDRYTGASVLCVGGAVNGGAGMVRYVGDDAPTDLVRRAWPEAVIGPGRVQAWTVGSGGGDGIRPRLEAALADAVPVVVDADALAVLAEVAPPGPDRPPLLLTPHAGELARLLEVERAEVEAHRLRHARAAAARFGAVVLLKGSTTVVAEPAGRTRVNPTGTPHLATAGSGDVLAGLAGALLAGGLDPYDAGSVAAYLHGIAGRLAGDVGTVSAGDVLAMLPRAFAAVRSSRPPGPRP